jgi:hypothetical protein
VPSQRFEGLAGAAEAVVKSDRSWGGIPGKAGIFLFFLGQPAEIGGQLAISLIDRQSKRVMAC